LLRWCRPRPGLPDRVAQLELARAYRFDALGKLALERGQGLALLDEREPLVFDRIWSPLSHPRKSTAAAT
jgi:hypothetical protein